MRKRQAKKHFKKAIRLSIISIEVAERYINKYKIKLFNKGV